MLSRARTLGFCVVFTFTFLPTGTTGSEAMFVASDLDGKQLDPPGRTIVIPACTIVRHAASGETSGKSVDLENEHWGVFRVKRASLDAAPSVKSLAECLATAPEYAGRFTEDQLTRFIDGELSVGIPVEWATLVYGPSEEQTKSSDRIERSWQVGRPTGACPLPLGRIESVDVAQLRSGRVLVGASTKDRQIDDLRVPTATPEAVDASAYRQGMKVYGTGDVGGALDAWLPLARRGFLPAAYSVADVYYRGDGVDPQLDEAVKWFQTAADGLYPPAMFHLGFLYAKGDVVEQDLLQAYRWMTLADMFGDQRAKKSLKLLEAGMPSEQLTEAKQQVADLRIASPELISKVEPVYPELANMARLEGDVILQAKIGRDGAVHDVEVLRENRPGMGFDEAAIEAVCQWRFKPASVAGKPVEVFFTVFVDFRMQ